MRYFDMVRLIISGGVISGQRILDKDRNPVGKVVNSKAFREFKSTYLKQEGKVFVLSKAKVRATDGRKFVKREYRKYFLENKKKA